MTRDRWNVVWAILFFTTLALVVASRATHRIQTDVEIERPASKVWEVFSDFPAYPDWNPFITQISGQMAPGHELKVTILPPGGEAMEFTPTVTELIPNRRFAWIGRVGLPRILDGAHYFEVEDLGNGRSRFTQREEFRGVLVPFLRPKLDGQTLDGFNEMNEALKARAESSQ
ncbi:MAG: SRPBCC domain-containing protein [Myxococcales bacterium]|nr:SRPBCC domain-containing protein [Myxococcales bacterium]MDH3484890.1 SRPBCC domain-containing protein [Myxococcales bacterium]